MAQGFWKLLDDLKNGVGQAASAVDDVLAPDFYGKKRTLTGNVRQVASTVIPKIDDALAPDYNGPKRTLSGVTSNYYNNGFMAQGFKDLLVPTLQATPRAALSTGLSFVEALGGNKGNFAYVPSGVMGKALFGNDDVNSIQQNQQMQGDWLHQNTPLSANAASTVGNITAPLLTYLDLNPAFKMKSVEKAGDALVDLTRKYGPTIGKEAIKGGKLAIKGVSALNDAAVAKSFTVDSLDNFSSTLRSNLNPQARSSLGVTIAAARQGDDRSLQLLKNVSSRYMGGHPSALPRNQFLDLMADAVTGRPAKNREQIVKSLNRVSGQGGFASTDLLTGGLASKMSKKLTPEQDEFVKSYADYLKSFDDDAQGPILLNPANDMSADAQTIAQGATRVSDHTPFYSKVYKEQKRPPTKKQWYEEALRQLQENKGDADAAAEFRSLGKQAAPANVTIKGKERGLVTSVKEAPKVSKAVKGLTTGTYTPKSNQTLMGEAQALLQDGASLDFKNVEGLDKKVAATIQEAINQQKTNPQAAANLFNNLSEHATELGRSVQAFSLLQKMSPESIALSAAGKIKKYNATHGNKIPELTGDQVKMIADKVEALDLLKGREKNIALHELNQTINSFIPSSITDKALTVWKAGLLTSLRTHERNFVGNTIHQIAETAKDLPATGADILMSAKTGQRTKTFTTKGLGAFGNKDTREQVADIIRKGYDPAQQIEKFDVHQVTWGSSKLEQGLKHYTDAVFRTLGASDKPFYNAAMARSLYDQAAASAINAGKRGDKAFIESLVQNPPEEMIKAAVIDANVATFKNENRTRSLIGNVKRFMGEHEASKILGEVLFPFTGVPSSILGQIVDYSPAGLIKGIAKAVRVTPENAAQLQRQAASEVGRGTIGTGIFALGAYLAGRGLITGQPKDQAEARQWELENKPRNSILIGGKWRSLNSIGPEAVVMLAGSKLNEMLNNPEGSVGEYATGLGKDLLDQSFVQGIQGPVNALTDPARYGKSYAGNLLSSPIPNLIKDLAKGTDDKMRETNTVADYVKSAIPGVRQSLTERRDVLGNTIAQEPGGIGAFVDLFNSKTPVKSPVVDELARLNKTDNNATPSKLQKNQSINGEKQTLTPEQLNKLEAGSGIAVQQGLAELIASPEYQMLNDVDKAKAIDTTVRDARDYFKGNLKSVDNLPDPSTADTSQQTAARLAASNTNYATQQSGAVQGQVVPTSGTLQQKKAIMTLEKKFKTTEGSTSVLGKSRAASQKESAIKAVYSAWLDGDITEEQAGQILTNQKIDPQEAEFTYVRSIPDDEVAPYVMEKLNSGEADIASLIYAGVLTPNVAKKMAEQGLITWDQYDGLKDTIDGFSNARGTSKPKKAKQLSIKINRSAAPAPKFVSLDTGSAARITAPKFAKITA